MNSLRVQLVVAGEIAGLGKLMLTYFTKVRLLSRMDSSMFDQGGTVVEGFWANRALEWSLPRMNPHVGLDGGPLQSNNFKGEKKIKCEGSVEKQTEVK